MQKQKLASNTICVDHFYKYLLANPIFLGVLSLHDGWAFPSHVDAIWDSYQVLTLTLNHALADE